MLLVETEKTKSKRLKILMRCNSGNNMLQKSSSWSVEEILKPLPINGGFAVGLINDAK